MRQYAVEFRDVSFQYGDCPQPAIRSINLKIKKGEFVLITGASGSGKTSLARCINGLIPAFHEGHLQGTVQVMGMDTRDTSISRIGETVGSVFQDPRSQFFMTDTINEVAFGCANMGLSREDVWARTSRSFGRLGIRHLMDKSIFALSSGEMQKVAIASSCAMGPDIYIFDEPSANLDMESVIGLRHILRVLKQDGKTILVLEHRLFYLADLFDRMLIVKDGVIDREYGNDEANRLTPDALDGMGLRAFHMESLSPKNCSRAASPLKPQKIKVTDVSFAYARGQKAARSPDILEHLSFQAKGGEIIGIVGANGAGKTTLARLCCGLLKEEQGAIEINGRHLTAKKRLGNVYYVMQDSDYQLFGDSVWNELTIGKRKAEVNTPKNKELLEQLQLWALRGAHPAALSRGQKQRLTIANALVNDNGILFFDEPTSGLDKRNMDQVAGLMEELAAQGRILFIITHDYEFLLSVCSRVLYLKDGHIQNDFPLTAETKGTLADILWNGRGWTY